MKRAAVAGLAGEVLFTVGWLAGGLWQGSGYRWPRDDISEMGAVTAPHAWLFLVPQAVAGLLTIGFALFGLLPALRPAGLVGVTAAWFSAGSAFQDLSDAAFRLDCRAADGCTRNQTTASWHGQLHAAFGLVCILLLIGAMFLTARAFKRLPGWAGWLQHVMDHADQFTDIGVPRDKVGQFVFDATTTGKVVGYQGKGAGRPIYEFLFEGRHYKSGRHGRK